jgi:hypothetical protein
MPHDFHGVERIWAFIQPVFEYLRAGFDQVNATEGLIIAIAAALIMQKWGQLLLCAVLAALAFAFVSDVLPTMHSGQRFHLPPLMEPHYWVALGGVAAGMLIIIAIFFALKSAVLSITGVGKHVGQH